MKRNPRQVIMEVCKWISEREDAKLYLESILTSIYKNLYDNPGNTNITRLQSKIPPKKQDCIPQGQDRGRLYHI